MKKIPLNLVGIGLTAAGAIITVVQAVVGEKQQKATIQEEVRKAIKNLK